VFLIAATEAADGALAWHGHNIYGMDIFLAQQAHAGGHEFGWAFTAPLPLFERSNMYHSAEKPTIFLVGWLYLVYDHCVGIK